MGRMLLALIVIALLAPACLGSESQPSGRVSVVVTLASDTTHKATHRYTLRCGPAGGTMPAPGAACTALADYWKHRSDPGRFCSGFSATAPRALLTGTFDGHRVRLNLTSISWCGVSDALMRDFWVLSRRSRAPPSSPTTRISTRTRMGSRRHGACAARRRPRAAGDSQVEPNAVLPHDRLGHVLTCIEKEGRLVGELGVQVE